MCQACLPSFASLQAETFGEHRLWQPAAIVCSAVASTYLYYFFESFLAIFVAAELIGIKRIYDDFGYKRKTPLSRALLFRQARLIDAAGIVPFNDKNHVYSSVPALDCICSLLS
jgi:hypothetical protein